MCALLCRLVMKARRGQANQDSMMSPEGKTFDRSAADPGQPGADGAGAGAAAGAGAGASAGAEEHKRPEPPPSPKGDNLLSDEDWAMSQRDGDDGSRPAQVGRRKPRSSNSKYYVPSGDGKDVALDEDDEVGAGAGAGAGAGSGSGNGARGRKHDDDDDDLGGDNGSRPADLRSRRPGAGVASVVREPSASGSSGPQPRGGRHDDNDSDNDNGGTGADDGSKPARRRAAPAGAAASRSGSGAGLSRGPRSNDSDDLAADDGSVPAKSRNAPKVSVITGGGSPPGVSGGSRRVHQLQGHGGAGAVHGAMDSPTAGSSVVSGSSTTPMAGPYPSFVVVCLCFAR